MRLMRSGLIKRGWRAQNTHTLSLSDRGKLDAEPCRGWAGIAGVSRLGAALIAIWRASTLIGPREGAKDGGYRC